MACTAAFVAQALWCEAARAYCGGAAAHVPDLVRRTALTDEDGLIPVGAEGAQLKQKITEEKSDKKTEPFDAGASMLGTDNEAGSDIDADEMALARKAPPPA